MSQKCCDFSKAILRPVAQLNLDLHLNLRNDICFFQDHSLARVKVEEAKSELVRIIVIFIHSFIMIIFIVPLQVDYSRVLPISVQPKRKDFR